jgi:hypothetical protein
LTQIAILKRNVNLAFKQRCTSNCSHAKPFTTHRSQEKASTVIYGVLHIHGQLRGTTTTFCLLTIAATGSVLFMQTKDQAKTKVMEHVEWLKHQYRYKPKWICMDKGKGIS